MQQAFERGGNSTIILIGQLYPNTLLCCNVRVDKNYFKRIQQCFTRMVKWPLTLAGLWPIEKSYWWYRMLPYAQLVISAMIVMGIINYIVHNIKNINIIIKVIGLLTSTTLYTLKLFIFTINRPRLAEFHAQLDDFCDVIMRDNRLVVPACKRIGACFHVSRMLVITCWGSFFMLIVILPFINLIIQVIKDPDHAKYATVYPTRYPWDTTSDGILYRISYLLESLGAFSLCLISTGVDGLILFYVFQATSQLRAMAYRVNNIREGESYDDIMKACAKHYATMVKCRNELQRIYGPIILYNVGSCAALLCTLIYQLSQATGLTKIQMTRVAVYIIAKSFQVFLYTWSGTLLHEESENYLRDMYLSDWMETKSVQVMLFIVTQRPLTIKACHLLISSVETFAKTMNTTISYFLLLRTIA